MGYGFAPSHSHLSRSNINIQWYSRAYFSEEGIEYNILRIPIGGTDCSTRKYTLYDEPEDKSLRNFTLADEDYSYKVRNSSPALSPLRALQLSLTFSTACYCPAAAAGAPGRPGLYAPRTVSPAAGECLDRPAMDEDQQRLHGLRVPQARALPDLGRLPPQVSGEVIACA